MPDDNGYPTQEELTKIATWPLQDIPGLMRYIGSLWFWPDYWRVRGRFVYAHTGGWSGNEDIVEAMMENVVFWGITWRLSLRGGHFKFEIPERFLKEGEKDEAGKVSQGNDTEPVRPPEG